MLLLVQQKMALHNISPFIWGYKQHFFYPSDLVNTKTTMPLRVGEEW